MQFTERRNVGIWHSFWYKQFCKILAEQYNSDIEGYRKSVSKVSRSWR